MGHPSEQAIYVAAKYDLQAGEKVFFCRRCNWDRKIEGVPVNECPNCGARLDFVAQRGFNVNPILRQHFAMGLKFEPLGQQGVFNEVSLRYAVETLIKRYEEAHPGQLAVLGYAVLVVSYEVKTDYASVLEREIGRMFGRVETHNCENWRLWALGLDDIVVLGLGEP